MRSVAQQFEHVVGISKNIQPEALINVVNTDEPGRLADVITPYLRQIRVEQQQDILETLDPTRTPAKTVAYPEKRGADTGDPKGHSRSGREGDGRHAARVHSARTD